MRVVGEHLGVPRTLTFGAPPSCSLAIGDFDANGEADIAIGPSDVRDVSVLLGDRLNPFASVQMAARSDWPIVDARVDLDGIAYSATSGALFSVTTVSEVASGGTRPANVDGLLAVVADFDGDGRVEMLRAPTGAVALASGDFDGDGFTDVAAADGRSPSVTLLYGDRDVRFARRRLVDVGIAATPHGLAAGDIDRDGLADLVVLADDCTTVAVLRADGGAGLLPYFRTTIPAATSGSVGGATLSNDQDVYQGVAALSLNPATIAGGSGAISTGTITLNAPAPAGGAAVTLTSSNLELAATIPSLTVPEGSSTASFTIGTNRNYRRYSGLGFAVTISATHGATSRSATLSVTAQPKPGTLSSFDAHNEGNMCFGVGLRRTATGYVPEFGSAGNLFNCVPPANPVGQDGTCTFKQECSLGCEFRPPVNGFKFRDVCATTGPFPVAVNPKLLVGGNQTLATLQLNAPAPVNSSGILSSSTVLANTIPNISTPIPAGATSASATGLTARVSSPQFAPIDGSYLTPQADGSRAGRGGLTWLALVPGTPPPFELTAFTLEQASVTGGGVVFGFAQMNQVAPAPEIATPTMSVSSSNPSAASIPQPSVTFTQGSSGMGVTIQTHAVSGDVVVAISAQLGGTTLTRQLTVKATPGATSVNSFFLDPFTVTGGENSIGTVVLNGAASSGGATVSLQSSNPAVATMPAAVTVPAGSDRTSFVITTAAVSASTTVTLNASYNSTWAATSLIVSPAASSAAMLDSLTMNPASVSGGNNSTGTATLTAAAPGGGAVVSLSSSNTAAANVPASVTIPAGATTAAFTAMTSSVGSSTAATIAAAYNGVTRSAVLTVTPPTQTVSLTLTATGRSGERVRSSPAGIDVAVGTSGSASFPSGTSITLSVTNGRDAIWSGACSSGGNKTKTCTFTLNAAASVTANVQ